MQGTCQWHLVLPSDFSKIFENAQPLVSEYADLRHPIAKVTGSVIKNLAFIECATSQCEVPINDT